MAWDAYGQTVARYQQSANILGVVLAEQTTRYVQVTDRVLQELQRRVGMLNIHGVEDFQARVGTLETHNLLRDSMQNLPPGNAFLLIDAQGRVASSSRSLAEKGEDLSDVDYFRHLMVTDDSKVTVIRTRLGKITGRPTMYVARRINTPEGDFLGVAVAAIDVLDLSRFHHAINKLPGQALTLLLRDGSVLTRDPDPLQFAGSRMPAESPWHNLVQAGGGTYRSPGFPGGKAAIVSVYPLSAYPLVVDISIREHDVFAGWIHEVQLIGVTVAGAIVVCVILFRRIDQQFLRLSEQNAALRRTAAALRDSEHVVAEK